LNRRKLSDETYAILPGSQSSENQYHEAMKIAFCTTCCNRLHQLQQVFDRNAAVIASDPATEWIILDFGSEDGLAAYMAAKMVSATTRITFARERSGRPWHASIAKNVAHRLSAADILVNLDCDNLIDDAVDVIRHRRYAGADVIHLWSGALGDGTCGRIAIRRDAFHALGGYDESFLPMGYQDFDLVHRAAAAGLKVMRKPSRSNVAVKNTKVESLVNCRPSGQSWDDYNVQNRAQSFANIAAGLYVANGLKGWAAFRVDETTGRRGPTVVPDETVVPSGTRSARKRSVLKLLDLFRRRQRPAKSTRRILFAWELGRGLGHLNRLLPIARAMEERGHKISFALRSNVDAVMIAEALPHAPILPVPICRRLDAGAADKSIPAYNYADILFRCGYQSEEALSALINDWHALFARTGADLVVCDHSPTAVLAAAGRTPVLHVGSGFANPPAHQPLIPLHPASRAGAGKREAAVFQAIAAVTAGVGLAAVTHVSDLFASAQTFACCLPELDPYRPARTPVAIGPLTTLPVPSEVAPGNFIFAYLAADDARVLPLLERMARARIRCSAFVRQAPDDWAMTFQDSTVRLFDHPQRMADTVAAASAVLHHGGLSTAECALAIGRPQLVLPRYLEQALTAAAIENLRCGINVAREDPIRLIEPALRNPTLAAGAREAAHAIAARPRANALETIVHACEQHLASPHPVAVSSRL
jgi:hypothetical protein